MLNVATQRYIANLRNDRLETMLSKLQTESTNKKFESRQDELKKYIPQDEIIAGEVDALINKAANGLILTEKQVEFLNENAYVPQGFVFNENGDLVGDGKEKEQPKEPVQQKKEIWQIPRQEYIYKFSDAVPVFDAEMARKIEAAWGKPKMWQQLENENSGYYGGSRAAFGLNAKEYMRTKKVPVEISMPLDLANEKTREHRKAVEQALSEGKPVPANVLADYPELQPEKDKDPVRNILALPIAMVDEIKKSVALGYDTIQVGMINKRDRGVGLINDKSQARGTYPLPFKEMIEKIVADELLKVSASFVKKEKTPIESLEAEYNSKSFDELIALKKKLYPNPDIESAMSPEEKLLTKVLAEKASVLNQDVLLRRKEKEQESVENYFLSIKGNRMILGSGQYERRGEIIDVEVSDGNKINNTGIFVYFLEDNEKQAEKIKVNQYDIDSFKANILKERAFINEQEKAKEPETETKYSNPKAQELIEKYAQGLSVQTGGSAEPFRNGAIRLIEKIEAKDYQKLHDALWSHNKASKKLFSDYTGIKLPSTDKGTFEILREFTGWVAPVKESTPKMSKEEAKEKMLKANADKALEVKINYTGIGILTKKEFVEKSIEEGYRPFVREIAKAKGDKRTFSVLTEEAKQNLKKTFGSDIKFSSQYVLKKDDSFWEINKSQYDYAVALWNGNQKEVIIPETQEMTEAEELHLAGKDIEQSKDFYIGEKVGYKKLDNSFSPEFVKHNFPKINERGIRFFTHRSVAEGMEHTWTITESATGMALAQQFSTKQGAIERAFSQINQHGEDKVLGYIDKIAEEKGFSPMYKSYGKQLIELRNK